MTDGSSCSIAVVGGGPAGLMAAETLAAEGVRVTVYDRMPTLARKLLMAGRGGLNLTHSEDLARFAARSAIGKNSYVWPWKLSRLPPRAPGAKGSASQPSSARAAASFPSP
jgi:predicted flavoprotein YhiN